MNFVFLRRRGWVVAERYPYFTMLGQSLGSMVLGMEAALKYPPDVFIDTMGYAFTFPIFKYLASSSVGAYVHYPTISTDMLRRVRARSKSHNNNKFVASNPFLTSIKLFYYKVFAWVSGVTILGDWISLGVEERFYYFRSEVSNINISYFTCLSLFCVKLLCRPNIPVYWYKLNNTKKCIPNQNIFRPVKHHFRYLRNFAIRILPESIRIEHA